MGKERNRSHGRGCEKRGPQVALVDQKHHGRLDRYNRM